MTQLTRRNKYSVHKNIADKTRDFVVARKQGGWALKSDGTRVPLTDVRFEEVEFISGRWCVQDTFPHTVQLIRDRELVLADKLSHAERIPFEYWRAYTVGENCFGYFLSSNPDTIVAKYETDDGVYWSYGKTIEQARAFLGIKLFDEYMDLIHATACKKTKQRQKK